MPDRRARLWAQVEDLAGPGPIGVEHVGRAIVQIAGVDGAAVWIAGARGAHEPVWASGELAAQVAEMSVTLGEGPARYVLANGRPVVVSDLADRAWRRRWPGFAPAAAELGVRAMLAVPLQVGAILLGVLLLHRKEPGVIGGARLADTFALADAICLLILNSVDTGGMRLPDGGPLWSEGGFAPEVHQATGMIVVQLRVSAEEAVSRLRAHAYARGRRLRDVARDVVARRLRFGPDGADDVDV